MRQKQKNNFSLRLRVVGGNLTAKQLGLFIKPLDELQAPVLLMGSREDAMCRRELEREYREMAAVIPRAEVCMFAHGGHPAIASNAEEAARAITGFFSAHPAQLS